MKFLAKIINIFNKNNPCLVCINCCSFVSKDNLVCIKEEDNFENSGFVTGCPKCYPD